MATDKKRPTASFNFKAYRRFGDFRDKVGTISANIAGNTTLFATPSPTVLVVNGHIVAMNDAQVLVGQRVPGSKAVRDNAFQVVKTDIRGWLRYVQGLADAGSYEQAIILITSAGFEVKVNGIFMKPDLRIKLTNNFSVIKLIAKSAGPRGAYEWQQSINNGASWTNLPTTTKANTEVSGLTAKTSYLFRFRSVVKSVTSSWSNPVSIIIQNQ